METARNQLVVLAHFVRAAEKDLAVYTAPALHDEAAGRRRRDALKSLEEIAAELVAIANRPASPDPAAASHPGVVT